MLFSHPGAALATTFYVGTNDDLIAGAANCTTSGNSDCSLREAVAAANSDAGASHTINIPASTITISISPDGTPDDNADGDFDFTAATKTITISGAGESSTIVDANSLDRVFDAKAGITLVLQDLTVKRGVTTGNGGCVLMNNKLFTATRVTFDSCKGASGGGVYASTGISITDSTFTSNWATLTGGGIHTIGADGNLYGTNTFTGNHADTSAGSDAGGCIYNNSVNLTIAAGSTFSGNYGVGSGGCIWLGPTASGKRLTINSGSTTTFDSNYSTTNGGGAIIAASVTLNDTYFIDNHATLGGAIYPLAGTNYVYNSTFEGNYSTDSATGGGAVYMKNAVYTLNIYNSTFVDNDAGAGKGGAIYHAAGSTPATNAYNSTFYNNTGTTTYALNAASGAINLYNSIVAHPTSAALCAGTARGGTTNNVDYNNSGTCVAADAYRFTGNPNVSTLASNGGYTKTMALAAGSSAIDNGELTTCTNAPISNYDQRGFTRNTGDGKCDIGAYESTAVNSTAAGVATAASNTSTSIDVSMPYGGDANSNNTYTVDYKLSSSGSWTNWVTAAAHVTSPYTTTITGLTTGSFYDVRVTYNDADGVTGTNPQTISSIAVGPTTRLVPSVYYTIQSAINASKNGDTIQVANGTYSENITFNGKLVTVISENGAASTTIQGTGANAPVVTFSNGETASAVLDGFTLDNVAAANSLTRGIYAYGASPTIKNSIITGNAAANTTSSGTNCNGGGGVCIVNGSPTLNSVTIKANTATNRNGCGIYIMGAAGGATITNSTIGGTASGDGNLCTNGSGGGIYYTDSTTGTLSISNSNIQYNQGNSGGGGIYATTITNPITITNTTIQNNFTGTSYDGGGIYITGSAQIQINGGSVSNNISRGGVGIYVSAGADITIGATTTVVIDNNDTNNCTSGDGGGIYVTGAGSTAVMTGGSITNNGGRRGSGVYVATSGDVTLTGVSVISNSSACGSNDGGGVHSNGGTFTAERSKIRGNSGQNGGGVYAWNGGTVTIKNTDITGNVASVDGGGVWHSVTMNIYNSTVAGNYSGGATNGGGGVRNGGGTLTITDGIIYGNTSASNAGISTSGTTNINYSSYQAISGACTSCANNRAVGEDPLLANLQQAGAGAPTTAGDFHLTSSSPVLNQGTNNGYTPDIDGDARPIGSAYDMGSDESSYGKNIAGIVYTDEGTTTIANGTSIRLIINGASAGTTTTSGGAYSFTTGFSAGDAILVYIDSNGGTVGNTVTVAGTSDLTGLNIYANRLITRHDNSGSLTNALMNTALGAYSDTDILYSVSSGNLTVSGASTELFVWTGHTFAPGGTVTTKHMDVRGTFNPAANAVNVSGNWNVDAAATFTSTGTVTFNASSGTISITPGGTDANHDFQNIVFNDAAGSATFQLAGAIKTAGNLTVTDGILDTTGSNYAVTVGGNFSQAAGSQVKANASTITVAGNFSADGSADGATPAATVSQNYNNASLVLNGSGSQINFTNLDTWYSNGFNNLTAGQSGVTDTLNYWLAVRGTLTIGSGTLTSPATTTISLRKAGDVLVFDAASNLTIDTLMFLNFNGAPSNQNIPTLTNGYGCNISIASSNGNTVTQTGNITLNAGKNLLIKGDGATARSLSYLTNNFSLTVGGNLVLGAGGDTGTKTLNMTNSSVSVAGNFTINSGANVLTSTGSTLTFTGTGIITDSSATKPQQFNNIVVNGTSLTLGSDIKTSTLTVTAGAMNLGSSGYTLELTGTGTPLSNSGTFTPGTSTVKYTGTSTATNIATVPYSSLQLAPTAATTYSLTGHLTGANAVTGSLTIGVNATLDSTGSNYNITLAGNWSNSGGFTANNGTVTLNAANGVAQAINGSTNFYNLIRSVTGASTLTFEATKTTTISGTVTLNGASGQLLTLASSTGSSAWDFVVNSGATKAISYVSVSWSNAAGSHSSQKPIAPADSTDGLNNTDWFAAASYQPDVMIKFSAEADGSYLTDNTYETTASAQVKSQGVVSASTAAYTIKFQNDSTATDSLVITGTATGSSFSVQYLDDTATDRTAAVTGAGYTISSLAAGASKVWTLNVTPGASVAGNTSYNVYVTATSSSDGAKTDQVKATTSSTSAVLTLLKNADKANAAPGEEIAYSVTASNGAGLTAASSVVLTDAIPANTGFKVGSASFNAGTSTLTNSFSYSNDNGSTWTYTPTSTGCSGPANYDYCVTHVKWTTSGSMPSGTNFSIGLVVVVK